MGGVNSMCIPTKSGDVCRENHARLPKIRQSKRNLSATFNISDTAQPLNHQININSATEEELMTLPGVNRSTAHNIVEYRQQIGGFRRVEDLALVSGVGANKLESLRLEICVSSRKQTSKSSSPTGSIVALESTIVSRQLSRTPVRLTKKININTSNVFQLIKVKGIGLLTAQNIVAHREKKGPYKSIDDLLKVKGIGPAVLGMIRSELCLQDCDDIQSNSDSGLGPTATGQTINTNPADSASSASDHVTQLIQMCGPLTQSSLRPDVEPFTFKYKNRHVVRIATWNIQQLTEDKVDNPGVKEVICMTILENGFGLIAFQELAKADVLNKICYELNEPTLPSVSTWKGSRGHWVCVLSPATGRMFQGLEYTAFLLDTQQLIINTSSSVIEKSDDKSSRAFVRKPFVAHFKIRSLDVALCSVHLKATGLNGEDAKETQAEATTVPLLTHAVKNKLVNENDIIVLGDFNLPPDNAEFDDFRANGYWNAIPATLPTNISSKNLQGSQSYDNLWASEQLAKVYTGRHGVVREGLTSPWIPDGWSWGGVVSDHCPVWAEFYTSKDLDHGEPARLSGINLLVQNEP